MRERQSRSINNFASHFRARSIHTAWLLLFINYKRMRDREIVVSAVRRRCWSLKDPFNLSSAFECYEHIHAFDNISHILSRYFSHDNKWENSTDLVTKIKFKIKSRLPWFIAFGDDLLAGFHLRQPKVSRLQKPFKSAPHSKGRPSLDATGRAIWRERLIL